MIGGMFPIIHLGRAWLFYWLIPVSQSASAVAEFPLAAAVGSAAIITYVTGSAIYLYLPLIPDMAQLAEHSVPGAVSCIGAYRSAGPAAIANGTRWNAP